MLWNIFFHGFILLLHIDNERNILLLVFPLVYDEWGGPYTVLVMPKVILW